MCSPARFRPRATAMNETKARMNGRTAEASDGKPWCMALPSSMRSVTKRRAGRFLVKFQHIINIVVPDNQKVSSAVTSTSRLDYPGTSLRFALRPSVCPPFVRSDFLPSHKVSHRSALMASSFPAALCSLRCPSFSGSQAILMDG